MDRWWSRPISISNPEGHPQVEPGAAALPPVGRSHAVNELIGGALAFYGKTRCLVVIDRDGVSYEVANSRPAYQPSLTDYANGEGRFGRLKISSKQR